MVAKIQTADSIPYWEGARQGRLLLQKCTHCGQTQFLPRHHCANCWNTDLEWVESSGKGRIESCTVVRRAPRPEFETPYVLAMIMVDENVRMMANIVGPNALDAMIGDRVRVTFVEDHAGRVLPQFRREAEEA